MNKLIATLLLALTAQTALAAPAADGPCDGLTVGTGRAGKGYSLGFADLKKVCGKEVALCEFNTGGGLDNLTAMATKDADVGFAQLDTIQSMKGGDENIAALQAVAGLNFNYLHVVTASRGYPVAGEKKYGLLKGEDKLVVINRFSDLRGKTVGVVGSATLLVSQLNKNLGYGMNVVEIVGEKGLSADQVAFQLVAAGRIAAALTVSGWPHGDLKDQGQNSGLTLVPFDAKTDAPYVVRPLNYKSLGVYNNNALAVPNLLMTRPFKGDKAAEVSKLKSCLTNKLDDLKEGKFQPSWNEIKSLDNTYDVPKFGGKASKK